MEIQGYPNYLIFPNGDVDNSKGKILKPYNTRGYLAVKLYKNKKQTTKLLHRLVAEHYIPNPGNYPEVDHIDRNKCNNDVTNLRWINRAGNCQNTSIKSTNTSGIKNISYVKRDNIWKYDKSINGNKIEKFNKNKNIILWIKFYDYIILKYNI